jgi:hypothetical protein
MVTSCGLVVRIPGHRFRGPDSISGATRFSGWRPSHEKSTRSDGGSMMMHDKVMGRGNWYFKIIIVQEGHSVNKAVKSMVTNSDALKLQNVTVS